MTIKQLLDKANEGYPDGYLEMFYDDKGNENKRGVGDTLAKFIVIELIETFDPEADNDAQINEAVRVMENAVRDLQATISALQAVLHV